MLEKIRKPIVLALVDGLGIAPDFEKNLFKKINTENFDFFSREYPAMSLYSSGKQIGLSEDEKSNSLLGHLNIGAGRLCYSSKEKINKSILDKTFFENNSFLEAKKYIEKNNSNLHLLGFLGINNEFSDEKQLFSLFEFCKNNKIKNVFLHIFLDIEDTIPETNKKILKKLQNKLQKYNFIKIASLSSKYFAMDEDGHWDRTKKTYEVVCDKENTKNVLVEAVLNDFNLLKIEPVRINTKYDFSSKDVLLFFNYSSQGIRQLLKIFALPEFVKFPILFDHKKNLVITMTEYEKELPVLVAFPKYLIYNSLPEIISKNNLSQYHIASGEKFSNITYYLNGNNEEKFENELDEMVIYDSDIDFEKYLEKITKKITNKVIKNINDDNFDVYFINFSVLDLASDFLENQEQKEKIIKILDKQLVKLADYTLAKDGTLFISSSYVKEEIFTENKIGKVPFLIIKNNLRGLKSKFIDSINEDLSLVHPSGNLSDIAPTILDALDIEIPKEMTGKSLLN